MKKLFFICLIVIPSLCFGGDFWPSESLTDLADVYSDPDTGHTVAVDDIAIVHNSGFVLFYRLQNSGTAENSPYVIDLDNAGAGADWRWHMIPVVGNGFTCGSTQWDDGSESIDGEQIANDTIDDDSIDWSDVTLVDFTEQTAWRVFYSNTDGDITELALGAANTFLGSDGASTAPSFQSLAVGDMPTSGAWDMSAMDLTLPNTAYDPTPSSDDSWQGAIMSLTSGEALTQWDVVYLKYNTDGPRAYAYDANSTDGDNDTYSPIGVILETTGGAGNTVDVGIGFGVARNDGWSFTDTTDEGKPVYCSDDTAGAIELTAPSDSGDHEILIGTILDEDEVLFNFGFYDRTVP